MKANRLDINELKQMYYYDSDLGMLREVDTQKLVRRRARHGYCRLLLPDGRSAAVHRVIWTLVNGDIPDGMTIDHIDRDKNNNRVENLRCVSQGENNRNRTGTNGGIFVWVEDTPEEVVQEVITTTEEDAELMKAYSFLVGI